MRTLGQLINDWKISRGALKKLEERTPSIIGNEAVRAIKNNFRIQGYDSGTGVTAWKPRSPETNKRYDKRTGVKGSVYQSSNPLLKQTGSLYNSVKYKVNGNLVFVGVDLGLVPYAQKMNEGGPGKWGKNSTNTPARPFMPKNNEPPNPKILKAVFNKIKSEREKALQNFKL
jgi:phage gpG-like protein